VFQVVDLDDQPIADGAVQREGLLVRRRPDRHRGRHPHLGSEHVSSVWRAHTPNGRAYWLTGALFTQYTSSVDAW
jgi:hypothetical protein